MTHTGTGVRRVWILALTMALTAGALALLPATSARAAFPGENGWLIFENGNDLWAMPSDGSADPLRAESIGSALSDPVFSPNGIRVAVSRDVSGDANVWVADFDPSGPSLSNWVQVTNGNSDGEPTWSSDGTEIAFVRRIEFPLTGAATATDPTGITLTAAGAGFEAAGVDAGDPVRNTATNESGTVASVSGDTVTLAAGLGSGWTAGNGYRIDVAHRQIFTAPVGGSAVAGTQISDGGSEPAYDDNYPMWSPAGDEIAFATTRNGNTDIYLMDTDGGNLRNFTGTFGNIATRPNWKPDGSRLVFNSPQGGGPNNLWTIRADGTGMSQLTADGTNDEHPVWSPDGSKVAFRRGGATGKTFVVPAAGGTATELRAGATTPASHNEPDWQAGVGVGAGTITVLGPSTGAPGVTAVFSASVSGGSVEGASYAWTLSGPGITPVTGTNPTFSYTPTRGGVFTVAVTVTDAVGSGSDSATFTSIGDIAGDVFAMDIIWLATEGITRGCVPDGTRFCPDDNVTRGQMAAFLVRAMNLTDDGGGNNFTDDDGSIFEADIAKLAAAGITRGCNPPANTKFCPDDNVTRGQMAAFLVRAFGLTDDGGGNKFTDDDGSIFEDDIAKLAASGITLGCNPPANTRFCPDDNVTRGQMAAFLHRGEAYLP